MQGLIFFVLGIISIFLIALVLLRVKKSAQDSFQKILEYQLLPKLETFLEGIKTKITETTGVVKDSLSKDISEIRIVTEHIKTAYEAKKQLDEEMRIAMRKIENVLVGARSRGESGENILHDALKKFPQGMIDYNFKVKGRFVEYALILPNQKRLPIDSKWPAYELINYLSEETDPLRRKELEEEIERVVIRKVKEVAEYVDPVSTVGIAIAALPDAVLGICRKAYVEAFRDKVLLMPYSMTVSYILALYNLYLQYPHSGDIENLESYLFQIERNIERIDKELENSVSRGVTMVSNAYNECKRLLGEIRGSIAFLKVSPLTSKSELISRGIEEKQNEKN